MGSLNVFALFSKYFIPTLLGMLSMSAVTAIDGIYVGHGIGSDAIAAINICIPVLMLFTGVGLMVGAGVSVVASIQLSRGQVKAARINVTQALLLVTLLGVVCCGLMMAFPTATARMLGASDTLVPLVREYLVWFVPSLLFQMWCSVSLFVIRLDGSPRLAMLCNVAAALATTVLGFLFIFPLGWGLKGAALAGTLGLLVGGSIGLAYIFGFAEKLRPYKLKWSAKSLRLTVRNWGYQCRIGSSALLTEATMAMLMFVGNHVFMQYLGDDGVGAFGIACYYTPFIFMVGNAIAQSAQPIISYNFGLGRRDRVADTERVALLTALVCGVLVTAVFVLLPGGLVGLFLPGDNPAARIAIEGFRCLRRRLPSLSSTSPSSAITRAWSGCGPPRCLPCCGMRVPRPFVHAAAEGDGHRRHLAGLVPLGGTDHPLHRGNLSGGKDEARQGARIAASARKGVP